MAIVHSTYFILICTAVHQTKVLPHRPLRPERRQLPSAEIAGVEVGQLEVLLRAEVLLQVLHAGEGALHTLAQGAWVMGHVSAIRVMVGLLHGGWGLGVLLVRWVACQG